MSRATSENRRPIDAQYGDLSLQWSELDSGVHLTLEGRAGVEEATAVEFAMTVAAARRPKRLVIDADGLVSLCALAAGHLNRGRRSLERAGTETRIVADREGVGSYLAV